MVVLLDATGLLLGAEVDDSIVTEVSQVFNVADKVLVS